jgi:hypothetical protein
MITWECKFCKKEHLYDGGVKYCECCNFESDYSLMGFLVYLYEKELINDYDFDWEKEIKTFLKNKKK